MNSRVLVGIGRGEVYWILIVRDYNGIGGVMEITTGIPCTKNVWLEFGGAGHFTVCSASGETFTTTVDSFGTRPDGDPFVIQLEEGSIGKWFELSLNSSSSWTESSAPLRRFSNHQGSRP